MSNTISAALMAQLLTQESTDPYLTLLTLSHPNFAADITLVNNSENIISNGVTFLRFPFKITLPADDGETVREVAVEFDNVSLDLIVQMRSVTDQISVTLQMVLASIPDAIQMSIEELNIGNIIYDRNKISAKLYMDDFLTSGLTSERYSPTNFRGLF